MKKKIAVRKLEETSWLAQIIADKMDVEFLNNGVSGRWRSLQILKYIVNEADDKNNDQIYRSEDNGKLTIIICDIPALTKHGYDFTQEQVQNRLRGLAERYTDFEGNYLVSVLTTNDLNSCVIKDISELLLEMAS